MFTSNYEIIKEGRKFALWSKNARTSLCYGTKKQIEGKKKELDELDKKDGIKHKPETWKI